MDAMAFEVTGTVQREAWLQRVLPPVEQVRPGLWSVPVPIAVGTLRYTLVYALELADGLALVDVGYDTDDAWAALETGLATAGCAIGDVRWLFVTHAHRDHFGLAGRLQREAGTRIAMHPLEASALAHGEDRVTARRAVMTSWLLHCGLDGRDVEAMLPPSLTGAGPEVPEPDLLLRDGDRLPAGPWAIRALWTPGHTPGHLCFVEGGSRLLLSGDHVLPRITVNVSSDPRQPGVSASPLRTYLDSLDKVAGLDVAEVLPAHEYRFAGLAGRVAGLRRHHAKRLDDVLGVVATGSSLTAWDVAMNLEWARPWSAGTPLIHRQALSETLAHLLLLRERGQVVSSGTAVQKWSVGSAPGRSPVSA
jgi:glyoxylase-like metal-dependent hydrolase (beta-lactamase superfamily II)